MKKSAVGFERGTTSRKGERLMAYRGHTKRKGELSELAFMYKAVSMGFGVAKPYGDSERFDFIVSSGRRLWRVQVKSTYKRGAHGYGVHAYGNRNRGTEIYTPEEIDLLVVYIVPEDAWYIIPIEAVGGRQSLFFYPQGSQRGLCRYEKYREAWWLLKAKNRTGRAKSPR